MGDRVGTAAGRPARVGVGRPAAGAGRGPARGTGGRGPAARTEWIVGRNAVVEALAAGVPATLLQVAEGIERDDRVRAAMRLAQERALPVAEVPRADVDRHAPGAVHQGVALQVPPYRYADPADLLGPEPAAAEGVVAPLVVALDGVTDPRNLGAIVRSAAAFGASGVVVPERRAASMGATAWKTSAGAAARLPVARATNLVRVLHDFAAAGAFVVGLAASGSVDLAELAAGAAPVDPLGPLVLVVGSEGRGLSRLVRETCDVVVRIPVAAETESLNAAVAVAITLYAVAAARSGR